MAHALLLLGETTVFLWRREEVMKNIFLLGALLSFSQVQASTESERMVERANVWLASGAVSSASGTLTSSGGMKIGSGTVVHIGMWFVLSGAVSSGTAAGHYSYAKKLADASPEKIEAVQLALLDQATIAIEFPQGAGELDLHKSADLLELDLSASEKTQFLAEVILEASGVERPFDYIGNNATKDVGDLLPDDMQTEKHKTIMRNALELFSMS